jgi:hypothetical protein
MKYSEGIFFLILSNAVKLTSWHKESLANLNNLSPYWFSLMAY